MLSMYMMLTRLKRLAPALTGAPWKPTRALRLSCMLLVFLPLLFLGPRMILEPQLRAIRQERDAVDPLPDTAPANTSAALPPIEFPMLTHSYDPAITLRIISYAADLQDRVPTITLNPAAFPVASFLGRYAKQPRLCRARPHRLHLRLALDELRASGAYSVPDVLCDPHTLSIQLVCMPHVAGSGTSLTDGFLAIARNVSRAFEHVVILPVRTAGTSQEACHADVNRLVPQLDLSRSPGIVVAESIDHHLLQAADASSLLLHRTAHSALTAILSRGTVYPSPPMQPYTRQNAFRWLARGLQMPPRNAEQLALDGMGAMSPSCCDFRAFGSGDGEKVLCANARALAPTLHTPVGGASAPGCWVLSLGLTRQWDFEEAIVAKTACRVLAFDCSAGVEIPEGLQGRVEWHKICLGTRGSGFTPWSTLLDGVANKSRAAGRALRRMPVAVKMDIEGWEVPVIKEMLDGEDGELPEQIAMEFHTFAGGKETVNATEMRRWFGKLDGRGYRLVHRADNPRCDHCSKITLVHTTAIPSIL